MKSCHTWKLFVSSSINSHSFHNCWYCYCLYGAFAFVSYASLTSDNQMYSSASICHLHLTEWVSDSWSCRAKRPVERRPLIGRFYHPKIEFFFPLCGFIFGWHTKRDKKWKQPSIDVSFMLISYVTNQLRNIALRFIVHEKFRTCPSSQWGSETLFIRVYKQNCASSLSHGKWSRHKSRKYVH